MLSSGSVRILDFDDSVTRQKKILGQFRPVIVDLKNIGPKSRLWLNKKTAREIRAILALGLKKTATFLGSGDFHHISSLLIEQFQEPISVIIFDFHPDWDILPPRLGCGSWVNSILKRPNIKKVVLLGVSSNDISSVSVQTGSLNSLKGNRVEIYPYLHRPTATLFKKVPDNISIKVERGFFYNKIYWRELRNINLADFFLGVINRIDTKQVYVSIDKDCLKARYSLTNWEEGHFELDELLMLLKLIRENLDIIGVDIAGDFSPPKVKGAIKAFCSKLDHPKGYSAKGRPESEINSINEQTNIKILEALTK